MFADTEMHLVNWVEREVFVPSNRDVNLSFYLNAKEGFSSIDTFAVIIYNMERSKGVAITTPNGIHLDISTVATLESGGGWFSFNLSQMWQNEFNSAFPKAFVLQFANYEFDGNPSIARIDNVTVIADATANP
jgi:hypothetical protein